MIEPIDARGVRIEVGAKVIYGVGSGSSAVDLVEGEVIGFTDSGRVRVNIIRRSQGHGWATKPVHVGPSRMIVLGELPASSLPTHAEVCEADQRRREEWRREETQ